MQSSRSSKILSTIALLAIVTALAACGDDDDSNNNATPTAVPTATPAPMVVALSGDQQVPPVASAGSGSADIVIDEVAQEIRVDVSIAGIAPGDILFAHFHFAPAGEVGGIVANLITSSPSSAMFSTVVTPADVIPLGPVEDFDSLVAAIRDGLTYINIHTRSNPGGELRGQTG